MREQPSSPKEFPLFVKDYQLQKMGKKNIEILPPQQPSLSTLKALASSKGGMEWVGGQEVK